MCLCMHIGFFDVSFSRVPVSREMQRLMQRQRQGSWMQRQQASGQMQRLREGCANFCSIKQEKVNQVLVRQECCAGQQGGADAEGPVGRCRC